MLNAWIISCGNRVLVPVLVLATVPAVIIALSILLFIESILIKTASTMAALSIAIIGKNKEPLYMKHFGDSSEQENEMVEEDLFLSSVKDAFPSTVGGFQCSPKHQFILHAALDRFEQLAGPTPGFGWRRPGVSGPDGMFVGLLCPVEEMRVYEDDAVPELQQNVDLEIKSLLMKIHQLYIEDLLNPFKEIGSSITSRRFDEKLGNHVASFNQSDGMI